MKIYENTIMIMILIMIIALQKCLKKITKKYIEIQPWKKFYERSVYYLCSQSLQLKKNICQSNPEKSSTTKINKHTASDYSLFTHCLFDNTKKTDMIMTEGDIE